MNQRDCVLHYQSSANKVENFQKSTRLFPVGINTIYLLIIPKAPKMICWLWIKEVISSVHRFTDHITLFQPGALQTTTHISPVSWEFINGERWSFLSFFPQTPWSQPMWAWSTVAKITLWKWHGTHQLEEENSIWWFCRKGRAGHLSEMYRWQGTAHRSLSKVWALGKATLPWWPLLLDPIKHLQRASLPGHVSRAWSSDPAGRQWLL